MSELKVFTFGLGQYTDNGSPCVVAFDGENNPRLASDEKFYLKSEADKVIAEKDAEIRRLKRAMWIARAKAYRYIAELIACFNPDYVRNRKMFTPNNLKQKQMNSLKWARLMLKIESKCRAKAEEYK